MSMLFQFEFVCFGVFQEQKADALSPGPPLPPHRRRAREQPAGEEGLRASLPRYPALRAAPALRGVRRSDPANAIASPWRGFSYTPLGTALWDRYPPNPENW